MHCSPSPERPGSAGGRAPRGAAGPASGGSGRGLERGGGALRCALSPAVQRVRRVPPVSHPGDHSDVSVMMMIMMCLSQASLVIAAVSILALNTVRNQDIINANAETSLIKTERAPIKKMPNNLRNVNILTANGHLKGSSYQFSFYVARPVPIQLLIVSR